LPGGLTIPGTIYYFNQGTPPSNGVILHAENTYADSLRVSLRVHDLSRQAQSFGATIPVGRRAGSHLPLPCLGYRARIRTSV
jgi:hypothetical protein